MKNLHTKNQIGVFGATFICLFKWTKNKKWDQDFNLFVLNLGKIAAAQPSAKCTYQAGVDKSEFLGAEKHVVHGLNT